MLVLTRKEGESIVCTLSNGQEIEVTLIELRGNQARIGNDADEAINIVRNEFLETV